MERVWWTDVWQGHNAGLKSDMVSRALRRVEEESAISSPSFFSPHPQPRSLLYHCWHSNQWLEYWEAGHGTSASSYLSISCSQPSSARPRLALKKIDPDSRDCSCKVVVTKGLSFNSFSHSLNPQANREGIAILLLCPPLFLFVQTHNV